MRHYNNKEVIEESKRDQLYDCHSAIESAVDDLHIMLGHIEYINQEDYERLEDQFTEVYYTLIKLYEELYYS